MAKLAREFLYVILLGLVLAHEVSCYKNYSIEGDRVCSVLAKKRNLKLDFHERSAIIVQETRFFDWWQGGRPNFHCNFQVDAISKDGIVAVIQKLDMRRNATTGECIDYVQFTPKHGYPSDKVCGSVNKLSADRNKSMVDIKGEIDVIIHVENTELKSGEKIDIELVFTAFKMCAKGVPNYVPCHEELCIWKGFFDDGIVNCPFNCVDETNCEAPVHSPKNKNEGMIWLVLGVLVLIIGMMFGMVACAKCASSESTIEEEVAAETQLNGTDFEMTVRYPTAPTSDEEEPQCKEPPPSYMSLFPEA